jgi:hypothetical protein
MWHTDTDSRAPWYAVTWYNSTVYMGIAMGICRKFTSCCLFQVNSTSKCFTRWNRLKYVTPLRFVGIITWVHCIYVPENTMNIAIAMVCKFHTIAIGNSVLLSLTSDFILWNMSQLNCIQNILFMLLLNICHVFYFPVELALLKNHTTKWHEAWCVETFLSKPRT